MTEPRYARVSTTWHGGAPDVGERAEFTPPNVYDLITGPDIFREPDGPILAIGSEGTEFIDADEYKRRTGEDWS